MLDTETKKRKRSLVNSKKRFILAMVFFIMFFFLIIGWGFNPFGTSHDRGPYSGGAVTDSPTDLASTASSLEPDMASSEVGGPLSGTWAMSWTNADGNVRPAFTIRFHGEDDRGTVEILNDDTEFDTKFRFDGDRVWFSFTRVFDIEISGSPTVKWPEISIFEGSFDGLDEISGEWAREDWDCSPGRDPLCEYRPDAIGDPARLVRE